MNYIKSKSSKNEYTRHEIIETLKCARGVMELLERENMNILLSQANQV
ncbi:MAG: hypothetical protein N4A68_11890 [Maledivibacter sp.]|nr:hypothetical protein [Maledivibacter sp.]